ncbi:MAG: terpene cyclase/mutase family protein [Thermoguttaceae bacterium]|nr:terpene cyclase/mutase family protein [Thermoguttaceae bacterium]MDW8037762.1 terpene cyclase/mutase family protein [Thermoguttaceae bacterium]
MRIYSYSYGGLFLGAKLPIPLSWLILLAVAVSFGWGVAELCYGLDLKDPKVQQVVQRGLDWLAKNQSRAGFWTANNGQYPTAMTGLAGLALLCEGSTTTQGKYAPNIRRAVDYLLSKARPNGLIGDPHRDDRYTYGHGFATLFLSQVLGEEEDQQRREELVRVLTKAVIFCGQAQTRAGGWGYVSAKDGQGFDEGSTTITQVQALRGCRNAGIPVPKEIIDNAINYIKRCTTPNGGVQYNSQGGGERPPITAAAIACLFNAGEYDSEYVPRLLSFCEKHLGNLQQDHGHWHYSHYYYAQVMYREGGQKWEEYRNKLYERLVREAGPDGAWTQGYIGPVFTTAVNLTILQLERAALPIYQR